MNAFAYEKPGFASTNGRGFHIKFDNGFLVSVQWGPENYCENRDYSKHSHRDVFGKINPYFCADAEVAVWDDNPGQGGRWLTREVWERLGWGKLNDDVAAHVSPGDVVMVMWEVSGM